jgi:hypothetical protein
MIIHPRLFYFSNKTTMNFGVNATIENRIGGDIKYIRAKQTAFIRILKRTIPIVTAHNFHYRIH